MVIAHMDQVGYDPAGRVHKLCHAVRDKWRVMGVTQGAGPAKSLASACHYRRGLLDMGE
jgi:hypothetical protein